MTTKKTSSKKTTKAATKKAAKKTTKTTRQTTAKVSKKAAKKTAPKSTKKTTRTKAAKRPVVQAPDEKSFWTTDGQILNSIVALNEALEQMHEAVYKYHVNKERHDFADWVESVLEDEKCAAALRRAKTPKTARTVVVRHLKLYEL